MKEKIIELLGALLQSHEAYVMRGAAHPEDLKEIESNFKEGIEITYQVLTGDKMSQSMYDKFVREFEL